MVTTAITCLDHGVTFGISDSTTRLSDALAQNVFFCRHNGTWHTTGCRGCRDSAFTFLAGRGLSGGIAGCHSMDFARLTFTERCPARFVFGNPALFGPVINPASPKPASRTVKLSVW